MKKIVCFGLLLVCVFLASCSSNTPGSMAKKNLEYVKSGDYEKFVDGIAVEEGVTTEDVERGKAMIVALLKEKAEKEIEKKGGIKDFEIVSETMGEDKKTADVVLKTTYGDGSTENNDLKMVLQEGTWKMDISK